MTQTQRMDASLIQVLEIVTLPTEELKEKIKREAEKNPVINLGEEEKSYAEIAEILGTSDSSVRATLCKAKKKIMQYLNHDL